MSDETADLQMFNRALEKALVAECDSQRARIERLEAERNEWKATANRIVDKATARIERLEALLEWMDHKGGLGLDVHDRIRAALAGKSHT